MGICPWTAATGPWASVPALRQWAELGEGETSSGEGLHLMGQGRERVVKMTEGSPGSHLA